MVVEVGAGDPLNTEVGVEVWWGVEIYGRRSWWRWWRAGGV